MDIAEWFKRFWKKHKKKPRSFTNAEDRLRNAQGKISEALFIAARHGMTDGAHNKQWCIDQMVRALTGSTREYNSFVSEIQSLSDGIESIMTEAVNEVNKAYKEGEDGPDTYHWDEGTAP